MVEGALVVSVAALIGCAYRLWQHERRLIKLEHRLLASVLERQREG